jgi:hypothetical protein
MFVHDLEVDEKGNALRDADGNYMDHGVTQVGDYFDVAFADTLHESPFDPKDDQGNFINQEPDFALPPGKRSEYRVKVSIPEDWADVKYVSFHAKDPVMAEGGGLAAQSVGNGLTTQADDRGIVFQQYAVEPGTYPVLQNRTTPEQSKSQRFMIRLPVSDTASAISSYADAPVSVYETGTYPDSKDSSVTKSSVPASGSAPKTGDGIPWGLLAGAGAAGAAMAAYSKRRLENEAAAAESENAE